MEAFNPTTARMRWSRRAPDFVAEVGLAALASSDSHRAADIGTALTTFKGTTAADLRAAILAGETEWSGTAYTWRAQVADVPPADGQARPPGARLRQRGDAVKIGLVTPYIYPLPGGVNAHVDELYENLVARGHDVRIISSAHGPQRHSEGDIIRLGYGFSRAHQRLGRHAHRVSPRYARTGPGDARAGAVRRAPFPRAVRALPVARCCCASRQSVNIATFHAYAGWSPAYEFGKRMLQRFARRLHGRIAVSAAARHFIERYFPGDYKVIPNGVDLRDFRNVAALRALGATARSTSCSSAGSRTARALMYLLKAYRQLRKTRLDCRLLMIGAGPQEREVRRYIATRRLTGVELLGRVSDADKVRYFATADVYVSPATGQESFGIVLLEAMAAGTPIVCCDIHGYKRRAPRRAGAARAAQGRQRPGRRHRPSCSTTRRCASAMGEAGRERAVQFGWDEHHRQGRDDYYGFVIRRTAGQGQLPEHFHRAVLAEIAKPQLAPLPEPEAEPTQEVPSSAG